MSEIHALDRLFATIAARKEAGDTDRSYTAKLLSQGVEKCAKKFGEEAVETVLAAVSGDKAQLAAESADVLYHLLVLVGGGGNHSRRCLCRARGARKSVRPGGKSLAQDLDFARLACLFLVRGF